eukprot:m51a1_g3073 hypothetical protein (690) ;mRNA; r:30216-32571
MGSRVSTAQKEAAPIAVKTAPEAEIMPLEGYDKALFMSTHTSFAEGMPSLKDQLRLGVRGMELVVHVKDNEMHVGRSAAGEFTNVAGNEEVGGSTLLEAWLSAISSWSRQRAGAHTPITVWLTLTNSFAEWGDFAALNFLLRRVFGDALFTPVELGAKFTGQWPSLDEMTGRVVAVLGGVRAAREGYRVDLCDADPSMAVNSRGQVVEAHERDGCVVTWIGQHDDGAVLWERRRVAGPGRSPAVSVNDNGAVVLVHVSPAGCDLQYRLGRLVLRPSATGAGEDEMDIEWHLSYSTCYDMGVMPAVALNNAGVAVAIHTVHDADVALAWRAALLPAADSQAPGEMRWMTPEELSSQLGRIRVPGRPACPSISFESPNSAEVVIVHSYIETAPVPGSRSISPAPGTTPRKTMSLHGPRDIRRIMSVKAGRERADSVDGGGGRSAGGSVATDIQNVGKDKDGAKPETKGTVAIRGIARAMQLGGAAAASSGSDSARGTPRGVMGGGVSRPALRITWSAATQTTDKPTRSRATVGTGSSRLFLQIETAPSSYSNEGRTLVMSSGQVAPPPVPVDAVAGMARVSQVSGIKVKQAEAAAPAVPAPTQTVVRLPQLCFVEAQRSEATLLSDTQIRFAGCAPRDEAFAMSALEASRVLRMWRFNAASCKRSTVNPNFPCTDFPESDWYLAYLNSCGS